MANTKSAEKRWHQSLKRRMRNRAVRTTARTHVKTVNRSIATGEPDEAALREAVSALDKAAEKGIIHRNNAARRKSRLMTRFAAVGAATEASPAKATATRARTTRATSGGTRATGSTRSTGGASRTRSTATKAAAPARTPRTRKPAAS